MSIILAHEYYPRARPPHFPCAQCIYAFPCAGVGGDGRHGGVALLHDQVPHPGPVQVLRRRGQGRRRAAVLRRVGRAATGVPGGGGGGPVPRGRRRRAARHGGVGDAARVLRLHQEPPRGVGLLQGGVLAASGLEPAHRAHRHDGHEPLRRREHAPLQPAAVPGAHLLGPRGLLRQDVQGRGVRRVLQGLARTLRATRTPHGAHAGLLGAVQAHRQEHERLRGKQFTVFDFDKELAVSVSATSS
mmetsp:Transcript_70256/g.187201  ORF Transcript_70256/g.187201 Transcript_70256/m.187201 type:complete len:244 (-) Transcript_70256:101-832(-)